MNEQQERSAFERWYEGHCLPGEADWFRRDPDEPDEYKHGHTSEAWAGWQARAALAANVPADLLAEALRTAVDHIDMGALELSHCKDWAQIKEALAAPAHQVATTNANEINGLASETGAQVATPAPAPEARTSPVHQPVHGWTDADADAARLALELECLLTDRDMPMPVVSRWWDSAHEAIELHRQRMAAPAQEAEPCIFPACQANGCREACEAPAQAQQSSEADEKLCREAMQRWRDAKPEAQQPLTDEMLDRLEDGCWDGPGLGARLDKRKFARAIEQAHGIEASGEKQG